MIASLKNLEKIYKKKIESKTQLGIMIRAQEEKKAELEAKAEEAAAAGDLDQYKQHKAEAAELEERLFVNRAQYNNTGTLDQEDVCQAWDKYMTDYSKKMDKAKKDIEAAKAALWEAFEAAVQLQNEAFKERLRCGKYLGIEPPEDGYFVNYDGHYPMLPINELLDKENANMLLKYYKPRTSINTELLAEHAYYNRVIEKRAPYIE